MKSTLLSLFKGYADTLPTEVTLQQIVNLIQTDSLVREHTEKYRYYMEKKHAFAATREKSGCPCFAVAVRFKGGKRREHITDSTRLGLADFDHIPGEEMERLMALTCADPHTLLAYRTISGNGIRVLFVTDVLDDDSYLKHYATFFSKANAYYARLLGVECDQKCKNITRLSGLAHDPKVYFNPKAKPFRFKVSVPAKRKSGLKLSADRLLQRAVAVAAKELEEKGIRYVEHKHNEYIMRMGYLLNAFGVPQEAATQWAVGQFADYGGDVDGIFRSCYRNTDDHGSRDLGKPSRRDASDGEVFARVHEIEAFLGEYARYRHNVITGKCEMSRRNADGTWLNYVEVDDRVVNTLWTRMSKDVKPVRICDIRNILASEFVPLFNPFARYFDRLEPWDGVTDYIGQLAATVHVREGQERFAAYFKKWLVGVVASLLDDEVVNHEILVLIGPQGTYKTTWFNNLLPRDLQRYFYVKANNNRITKDDVFTLAEFALICLEEIDELRPSELNQLKAMVTMKNVNERMAYGHYKECRPHIASFCGTSNNPHFLSDPTGNRRWLPFEVDCIDDPYAHPVPYDKIYAQAYALWKSGFAYWFDTEEVRVVNVHNKHFEVPNLEAELVHMYFRRPLLGEECKFVTTAYVLNRINVGVRQPLSATKIGIAMKNAGFELLKISGQRGYRVVEYTDEEVARNQRATARFMALDSPDEGNS